MNGKIMANSIKFVFISDDYRKAWDSYIKGAPKGRHPFSRWLKFDNDFKEKYRLAREREEFMLQYVYRPNPYINSINPDSYINDALGVDQVVYSMDNMEKYFPVINYQYSPEIRREDFNDLMMKRAQELASMDRVIDVLYSGGIDSTAIVLALMEVCPRDQLHIIAGGTSVIRHYEKLWDNYVSDGWHTLDESGNLYGQAKPDKHLFVTGAGADVLFGMVRYHPKVDGTGTGDIDEGAELSKIYAWPSVKIEGDEEWNYERWWPVIRYSLLTQSFMFIQNITCKKISLHNFQPFFWDVDIRKWAINEHINKNMFWFHEGPRSSDERFIKAKMMLRDFIAQWDKDYAYNKGKTRLMEDQAQKEFFSPLANNFNVKAITDNGTIVDRDNIMEYMVPEALSIGNPRAGVTNDEWISFLKYKTQLEEASKLPFNRI
jgi:hypothetical protein